MSNNLYTLEELTSDELAALERYRKERDSDNEYTPWIEQGISELQYYHRLYLETSNENARLTAELAWIPVTERLPENETSDIGEEYLVLLRYPYEISIAASFVGGDWYTGHVGCSTRWTDKVTHWRPLPPHPDTASNRTDKGTNNA